MPTLSDLKAWDDVGKIAWRRCPLSLVRASDFAHPYDA
jgi:hypothetical protein